MKIGNVRAQSCRLAVLKLATSCRQDRAVVAVVKIVAKELRGSLRVRRLFGCRAPLQNEELTRESRRDRLTGRRQLYSLIFRLYKQPCVWQIHGLRRERS